MSFRNAVFAGGGSRCFWQLGFWEGAIQSGLDLRNAVKFIGSTSAGCAIASAAVLDRSTTALNLFKDLTTRNPRNIHWQNLNPLRKAPLLPHAQMYREALELFIRPEDLSTLNQFSIRFLMSGAPKWLSGAASAVLGLSIYGLERTFSNPLHPKWPERAGFRPIVGRANDCKTVSEYIDLVLAASCVPPVLPEGKHENENVLDGGLIDNVPTLLAKDEPGETLVLLSSRYESRLPNRPRMTYVQPSEPIRIDKFDYANPDGLQETFELGLVDGTRFAREKRVTARTTVARG
ncbi:MAG: patatin-like phospholipase family protein [Myxococcales bacterium]|nr:patatin-like phospholipase family protein [Myxococcales bacterium]MDH3483699.1 patatin-like phospholipase family protein [Myxococcales bacterium]